MEAWWVSAEEECGEDEVSKVGGKINPLLPSARCPSNMCCRIASIIEVKWGGTSARGRNRCVMGGLSQGPGVWKPPGSLEGEQGGVSRGQRASRAG